MQKTQTVLLQVAHLSKRGSIPRIARQVEEACRAGALSAIVAGTLHKTTQIVMRMGCVRLNADETVKTSIQMVSHGICDW